MQLKTCCAAHAISAKRPSAVHDTHHNQCKVWQIGKDGIMEIQQFLCKKNLILCGGVGVGLDRRITWGWMQPYWILLAEDVEHFQQPLPEHPFKTTPRQEGSQLMTPYKSVIWCFTPSQPLQLYQSHMPYNWPSKIVWPTETQVNGTEYNGQKAVITQLVHTRPLWSMDFF